MVELLLVATLALTHLAAPHLLRFADRYVPDSVSTAHGLAVAFVFLHLLPEIGTGLADHGLALGWLVLLGFLTYNAIDNRARSHPRPGSRLGLSVGLTAVISWLIGASLPGAVDDGPVDAVLVLLAAALHLLEGHHRDMEGGPLAMPLRALLAAAVVGGLVADELWAEEVELLDQGLVALAAGAILTGVFRDHFQLDATDRRFERLVVAAVVYGIVLTLAATF